MIGIYGSTIVFVLDTFVGYIPLIILKKNTDMTLNSRGQRQSFTYQSTVGKGQILYINELQEIITELLIKLVAHSFANKIFINYDLYGQLEYFLLQSDLKNLE